MFEVIKNLGSDIPDKKKWIDVITATLTIPVLLTVIISNVNNIKSKEVKGAESETTPTQAPLIVRDVIQIPESNPIEIVKVNDEDKNNEEQPTSTPVPQQPTSTPVSCKLDPQPIEVSYPKENSEINVDPVCVVMEQKETGYCDTTWAYRVNNSSWSTYTKDPICLYNMANGAIKLEVRTKNRESGREATYTRNFNYQKEEVGGAVSPTPTIIISITPNPSN